MRVTYLQVPWRSRYSASVPSYFITFHTYGTRLHGDEKGSVDHEHNNVGTPELGHRSLGTIQDVPSLKQHS